MNIEAILDKVAPQRSHESYVDVLLRASEDPALTAEERALIQPERIIEILGPEPWPWRAVARLAQLEPTKIQHRTWLELAGRGFGKTRSGAEWAHECAARYALGYIVGPTKNDVRTALIEGESGILATARRGRIPEWKSQEGKLIWPNGSVAYTYSAEEPNRLRNKQGMWAWSDEVAAWQYLQDTWDNLQFGLRLGPWPRNLVTTTPRGIDFLRKFVANAKGEERGTDGELKPIETVVTGGSTFDNAKNLSPKALQAWRDRYEGTRLGRQELEAEILDDAENALWTHAMLDVLRVKVAPCALVRVGVAIDPSAGSKKNNDEQGIGVAGLGENGHLYALADRTVKLSPDGWADAGVQAAIDYGADFILGEVNCGGEMVEALVKAAMARRNVHFRYILANAKMGKGLRAEPVSAVYEQGRAHHIGTLAKLEDEMCLTAPAGFQGTKSPNRLDAMVWAMTELLPGVYQTRAIPKTLNVRAIQIDDEDRRPELTAAQVALLPDAPSIDGGTVLH